MRLRIQILVEPISLRINYVLIYLLGFPAAKWSMKNVCGVPTHYCLFRGKYTAHSSHSLFFFPPDGQSSLHPSTHVYLHFNTLTFFTCIFGKHNFLSLYDISFIFRILCVSFGAACTSIRDKEEILCASRHYCWRWVMVLLLLVAVTWALFFSLLPSVRASANAGGNESRTVCFALKLHSLDRRSSRITYYTLTMYYAFSWRRSAACFRCALSVLCVFQRGECTWNPSTYTSVCSRWFMKD